VNDTTLPSEELSLQQSAFLLQRLSLSSYSTLPEKEAKAKPKSPIDVELGLETVKHVQVVLDRLVVDGSIARTQIEKKKFSFTLTEQGKITLHKLARHIPLLPSKGAVTPPKHDEHQLLRERFLLEQLRKAPEYSLDKKMADKAKAPPYLELNAATARSVRAKLVREGCIALKQDLDNETYTLTEAGEKRLDELNSLPELARHIPLLPGKGDLNPPIDDQHSLLRERFLLEQLHRNEGLSISKQVADRAKAPHYLGLNGTTARNVRAKLVQEGCITLKQELKDETYTLTDAGEKRLRDVVQLVPILPPMKEAQAKLETHSRTAQEAYLLLEFLEPEDASLLEHQVSMEKFPEKFGLNETNAWLIRHELVQQKVLAYTYFDGKAGYQLTEHGKAYLADLNFSGLKKFSSMKNYTLSGTGLDRLLNLVRGDRTATGTPSVAKASGPIGKEALQSEILKLFEELRREKHSVTGMVPIYEIRQRILESHGAEAASHRVFDEAAWGLWRTKQVRITPMSDRTRFTPQQLDDSLTASGDYYIYLERLTNG
jgi:predicted transcriptional regulator